MKKRWFSFVFFFTLEEFAISSSWLLFSLSYGKCSTCISSNKYKEILKMHKPTLSHRARMWRPSLYMPACEPQSQRHLDAPLMKSPGSETPRGPKEDAVLPPGPQQWAPGQARLTPSGKYSSRSKFSFKDGGGGQNCEETASVGLEYKAFSSTKPRVPHRQELQ